MIFDAKFVILRQRISIIYQKAIFEIFNLEYTAITQLPAIIFNTHTGNENTMTSKEQFTASANRLIHEKSPYLLQHAHNPVDWYSWGPEAFEKAHKENKPVFLSIGYSTCHWCHVMAHESFEDPDVAKLMNDTFVSVKVDREERPDIDNVYMLVCQMMTGSGGWPLTIIMTPEKKPFFAATYIPKSARFGRMGMLELVPHIGNLWLTQHDELVRSSEKVLHVLKQESLLPPEREFDKTILKTTFDSLSGYFDERYSGFGSAPKFPTPHNLTFLLRYWKSTGEERALAMVERTLKAMRHGGIYDHIGSGFHRYSTDVRWLVPHFEKMLYDQALLAITYTEMYQATGKDSFASTAQEILTYVLRDMTSPEGGFYSAEDADSEGEEGKFYLWTEEEIREVLTGEEADLAIRTFNVKREGNFTEEATGKKTNRNILHLTEKPDEIHGNSGMSTQKFEKKLKTIRQKLFKYREQRTHPDKDDKILTDWNGLMIAALAKGSQVFNEPSYRKAAEDAVDFILTKLRTDDGLLLHRYRDEDTAIDAHLDDYAFLIWGLIELYEATFMTRYLREALELTSDMIDRFRDESDGSFYFTASDSEDLIIRRKESYDGVIPSGNSVTMINLLRLGRMTARTDFEEIASEIGHAFSAQVTQSPNAHTHLLTGVYWAVDPSYEVIIVGDTREDDTMDMVRVLQKQFLPNTIVILRPAEEDSPEIDALTGYTQNYQCIDGRTTAYVCRNYQCELPTTDTMKMLELLRLK